MHEKTSGGFAGVLLVGVFMFLPGGAQAYVRDKGARAPVPLSRVQPVQELSPIVVRGKRPSLPMILRTIKTGLHEPVSFARKDLDKFVCRVRDKLGTHIPGIYCETNRQIWRRHRTGCKTCFPPAYMGNASALLGLIRKLPKNGGSYTLRVTDHGKVVKTYIVKDGKVVKVIAVGKDGGSD